MGFSGTAFCHIGGNAMAAAIKLRSTPCCASGCVADTGVGFSVKNSKAQSFLQVCGSVGVGGNLCHAWSCKGRFGSGQTVPLPNQGAERQNRMRGVNVTQAVLRTNSKDDTLMSVEIQMDSTTAWVLDQEHSSNQFSSNLRESTQEKPEVEELPQEKALVEIAAETGNVEEGAMAETSDSFRDGKSSLGAKGGNSDEFQLASLGPTNDEILKEALAEAVKVSRENGITLGQKLAYNEGEVEAQGVVMKSVKAPGSGQASFVRKASPSNAHKRRQFWDNLRSSVFAKTLQKDGMAIKSWLLRDESRNTAPMTSVNNILANDIDFMKWKSTRVGPLFSKKVGEIVALRIIEDENATPGALGFWPQPYYPELRGKDLLIADFKTLESYSSYIQSVLQNFQVPLQTNYDPDQVAAYFHRRPHVLLYRLLEVGVAFGSVALERGVRMSTLKKNKLGGISEKDNTEVTLKTAVSLKQALLGLGSTFIKVAQSLSARPDLIGTETAKVLAELQDRLPPFPKDEAIAIIERELGCSVAEVFSFLSEEPVAAASFGQVYRGRTKSGEEVAVKVQRPNLLFNVARDVYILRIGMIILQKVAKLSNNYALVADEIAQGLYGELDYRLEAANGAEFALAHKHIPWMYVPKTFPHMTRRKLLVMEWLKGDRPLDLQSVAQGLPYVDGTLPSQEVQEEARRRLLNMVKKGTEAALIQLLETGVMHADPHPGNILLGRDGQLQFLDFGLITHMDKKHQDAMLALIVHLVNGDWQGLTDDLVDMDVVKPTTDRFAVRLALERAFGEGPDAIVNNGIPDPNFSFNKVTKKFFRIAYKFKFRLPPYYTLVLRSLASLEGFSLAVDPEFKTFGSAYSYAVRRVLLDYSPTTQRMLRSLFLTENRAIKWERISNLLSISQKSVADRAVLEVVTIPKGKKTGALAAIPDTLAGLNNPQSSTSNIARLLSSRQGVGIRRVMYEADARDIAYMFVSARAAKHRRIIAERLGEALFNILKRKYTAVNIEHVVVSQPVTMTDRIANDRRLHLILKSMVERLRPHPILLARAGWTSIFIALWAAALALHDFAIHVSFKVLEKAHSTHEHNPNIRTQSELANCDLW